MALADLRRDFQANSSRASSASLRNTWCSLATSAADGGDIWPLMPQLLELVAAAFKAGGHRSFPNYLSRARAEHIDK
eukprot:3312242-Amphidinium_carterae.1